jgi:putative NIF3 family GTP cyclohydrolase 1 type 2
VGVACGSAAEFLSDAARLGCDTFVTGEARFHAVLEAQALGINLILTGHYASERPAVEALADRLHRKLPALCCFASEADADPLIRYSG